MTKAVLAAGGLAAAVAAILALLPARGSDTVDSARFNGVHITSPVPLSEYQRRSAAMVPQASGDERGQAGWVESAAPQFVVASNRQNHPTPLAPNNLDADTPTPEDGSTSSSTATSTSAPATTSTSVPPTTGPPATGSPTTSDFGVLSPSVRLAVPRAFQHEDLGAYTDQVFELVEDQDPSCDDPDDCELRRSQMSEIIVANSTDADGKAVPPDVAAERVAKLFRDSRQIGKGSGTEPLGVVVSADLELVGLKGRPVLLSWSMWRQGGEVQLHDDWLTERLAFRLEASTDHDTTTLDLWVPLPKEPGPYFIQLSLATDGSGLASALSQTFD